MTPGFAGANFGRHRDHIINGNDANSVNRPDVIIVKNRDGQQLWFVVCTWMMHSPQGVVIIQPGLGWGRKPLSDEST